MKKFEVFNEAGFLISIRTGETPSAVLKVLVGDLIEAGQLDPDEDKYVIIADDGPDSQGDPKIMVDGVTKWWMREL